MGRIRRMIDINGRKCWTLFDSGARNTYIVPEVASRLITADLPRPTYTKLAGETKSSSQAALLVGEVEGKLSIRKRWSLTKLERMRKEMRLKFSLVH